MPFDTLIRGAMVLDGSGRPAFPADVAIRDGRIAAVGDLSQAEAGETVEARGRYLTPGFIDVHRHADAALFRPGFGEAELCQGLTTIINGNCGLSIAPMTGGYDSAAAAYLAPVLGEIPPALRFSSLEAYFRAVRRAAPPLHQGMLVGMGMLRTCVAGFAGGDLDREQERRLHILLEQALADGALGVSLGLGYAPECFCSTGGLIRSLAPLRGSGIPVTVHMRQEGDGVAEALEEMLTVARALRTPVEISHLKAIGRRNWRRRVPEMLRRIARAREEGVSVGCDVYPYAAGSTQLIHVLPPEFQEGGTEALLEALADPYDRAQIRRRMEEGSDFENIILLVGFENVRATSLSREENRKYEGRSIADIAAAEGKEPFDALFDLLLEEECTPAMIDFIAHEDDIADILRAPFSGVISDAIYPSRGLPHPRLCGTFARLLETYVRERRVLSLEAAVHKVTGKAASRFGLERKGRIAVGADADLCLFALEDIHEPGTYAGPARPAQGMAAVYVGGVLAVRDGQYIRKGAGTCLRR